MTSDPALLSATDLLAAFAARTLSPVDAARAAYARIHRLDGALNGFCALWEEEAMAAARASEARWAAGAPAGPLDGVPATVKDIILVRGKPTLRGSRTVDPDQAWDEDAPVTARLREAGAVLLGRTTTPEFGWKGIGDSPLTGITRNPWNTDTTPGGSSAGAATATATGMGALAVGTDGGGSIRIPASFTGIYGIKASFGRVPAYPASPFGTVSHVGPMTRTVADAALMLTVISAPDPRDWYALPATGADFRSGIEDGVAGWRIAFSPRLGYAAVDPEVAALVAQAARVFEELGAHVEEVDPGFPDPEETFRLHWWAGAANLLAGIPREKHDRIDPGLRRIAAEGAEIALLDYMAAVREREALGRTMNRFHVRHRILLTPTMPIPAFAAGHDVPPGSGMERWIQWSPFSIPFNLSMQPAATVPCGLTRAGLPVGLQLVGALHDEASVLRASRAFETARPFPLPPMATA